MDILYHKTCYTTFTSKEHIQRAVTSKIASEFDPYKISFDCIREKVHTHVISNKTVLPLSLLKSIYIKELNHNGVMISQYRTEKFKNRLESEFGNAIGFYMPTDRSGYFLYNTIESQLLEILEIAQDNMVPPSQSTDHEDMIESEDAAVDTHLHKKSLPSALSVRRSIKS